MVRFKFKNDQVFPSTIYTDRLILKGISTDVIGVQEAYQQYSSIEESALSHIFWDPHGSPTETHNWIKESERLMLEGDSARYFIFPRAATTIQEQMKKSDHTFLGTADFEPKWNGSFALSGIFLFPDFWGNGLSPERGEVMLNLTFDHYNLDWYVGRCSVENKASQRAIDKYVVDNGGERVGIIPYKESDTQRVYYKISKDQYKQESKTNRD